MVDDDLIAVMELVGQQVEVFAGILVRFLLGDLNSQTGGDVRVVEVVRAELLDQRGVGSLDLGQGRAFGDREGLDVVGEDHVVLHHVVNHVDGAVEHVEAVAQIAQRVVIAGQIVFGIQIQIDPFAVLENLHVVDAVFAGRAARPDALIVLLGGVGDGGIDLVLQAGDLEEAAALGRVGGAGAPFQRVENLLAGHGLQAGDVAEGVDVLAAEVGDIAGDGPVAHAAAVHEGDVHVVIQAVKQVVQGVGGEVAGVGLHLADQTAGFVVVVEGQGGVADDLAQSAVDLVDPVILDLLDSGIGVLAFGDELGADRAVGSDAHHADGAEVAAGLGQDDVAAGLILDDLLFHGAVGVAVDEGVQTGGVGDQLLGGPGAGGRIDAQVAQGDHDVGLGLCSVDGGLNVGVEGGAVFAAGDAVDIVAVFILEVGGGGLGEGFGGGDADQGDLPAAQLEDLVGVKHVFAAHAVLLVVEVAGNVGEVRPLDRIHAAFHRVVELVVAERRQVVVGGVHQIHDRLALVHGAEGGALDVVAGVNQDDVVGPGNGLLQTGDVVIAEGLVDVGVNVVRVEDDGVLAQVGGRMGLEEAHEHHGDLRAGRGGSGLEQGPGGLAGAGQNAVDDALGHGPLQGLHRPGMGFGCVGEDAQVGAGGCLKAHQLCVAVEELCKLLTGDCAVRIELRLADAVGDAVFNGPGDGHGIVPAGRNVAELRGEFHRRLSGRAVEDGDEHGARQLSAWVERR